jgi:hypothetical protein
MTEPFVSTALLLIVGAAHTPRPAAPIARQAVSGPGRSETLPPSAPHAVPETADAAVSD